MQPPVVDVILGEGRHRLRPLPQGQVPVAGLADHAVVQLLWRGVLVVHLDTVKVWGTSGLLLLFNSTIQLTNDHFWHRQRQIDPQLTFEALIRKHWSLQITVTLNSDYIHTIFTVHSDFIHSTFRLHSQYIQPMFRPYSDYMQTTVTLLSDHIHPTVTLHSPYILTTFTLHSDYSQTTFRLHSHYVQTSVKRHKKNIQNAFRLQSLHSNSRHTTFRLVNLHLGFSPTTFKL